jgi:aconitate hydratase
VGKIIEYFGEGVASLSVPARGTITNMGAELGATTSVFPSDERTREYFRAQKREEMWRPLAADADADYDEVIEIDLDKLGPMVARPQNPDNVVPIEEVEGTKLAQVCVGSCTNSSYHDLTVTAAVLKGHKVNPGLSMTVTPGSRQVFNMIARSGALPDLIQSGARILESACGPCIGMGQSPPSDSASLRTFNRNFPDRSGTPNDRVYLASPEVAAVSALAGEIADPRKWGAPPTVETPSEFIIDDDFIIPPLESGEGVEVVRGPNIKPLPLAQPLEQTIKAPVLIKLGDNISTDDILPAGSKVLPLRSNIPAISEYVFHYKDPEFAAKAKEAGASIIVGASNYGQGSSREHAALAPMYLGVKAVLAKTYARLHHTNLVNFGILPLVLDDGADDRINVGDVLEIPDVRDTIHSGQVTVRNTTQGYEFTARHNLSERQIDVLLEGGQLNYVKAHTT